MKELHEGLTALYTRVREEPDFTTDRLEDGIGDLLSNVGLVGRSSATGEPEVPMLAMEALSISEAEIREPRGAGDTDTNIKGPSDAAAIAIGRLFGVGGGTIRQWAKSDRAGWILPTDAFGIGVRSSGLLRHLLSMFGYSEAQIDSILAMRRETDH